MKGIFCSRPIFPRYNRTWNVDIVLDYILTLSPVNSLLLHMLTLKLIMLISLLTAQRLQTLELIDIKDCVWSDNELRIKIGSLIKTAKPGSHLKNIVLPAYKHDQRLCIVQTFIGYIKKTAKLRGTESRLFIGTVKPHKHVSKDTISRWIKLVLSLAGIDIKLFKSHSVRSASTSAAKSAGIPIQTILKTAGWQKESTFRKYYDKPVKSNDKSFSFGILQKFSGNI